MILGTSNYRHFRHFLLCALIALAAFISCSENPVSEEEEGRPQIVVTGSIDGDTVWESGKDYEISGNVEVKEGVILTIQGDVSVLFKPDGEVPGKLFINGHIQAIGEDSVMAVRFAAIDGINDGEAWGIELNEISGQAKFHFCRFEGVTYGVNSYNSSVEVMNCFFTNCTNGVVLYKGDSLSVAESRFEKCAYGLKVDLAPTAESDTVYVTECLFEEISAVGVEINNNSKGFVKGCFFKGCDVGLCSTASSFCKMLDNEFQRCNLGGYYYVSTGLIKYNSFIDNDVALKIVHRTLTIIENNFYNVMSYKIIYYNESNVSLHAENNWWDSIQQEVIRSFMWDGLNSTNDEWEGVIDFEPFLMQEIYST